MKTYPTSLDIQNMQIKTKVSYHYPPVRMATIKNNGTDKYWEDVEELGHSCFGSEDVKMVHCGTAWQFIKKQQHMTTTRLNNCTPGHLSQRWKLMFIQKSLH